MSVHISIQTTDFDLAKVYAEVRKAGGANVGAVATFVGLVRDRNAKAGDGSEVSSLTLEHYPGMTESSIAGIAEKAIERWPILDLYIYHRVGELQPTDQIVLVVASSSHREAAFAAAEFVMDYLKTDAVFWKKEKTSNGEKWIETTTGDRERAKNWK